MNSKMVIVEHSGQFLVLKYDEALMMGFEYYWFLFSPKWFKEDIRRENSPRKQAQNAGLKKYFTGRKCLKGHLTYRYTNSGSCSSCVNRSRK